MSRKIDALVEKAIFNNKVRYSKERVGYMQYLVGNDILKHYSTDIAAAWEVLEKLKDEGIWFVVGPQMGHYACAFDASLGEYTKVEAETAPMAICLAALKAAGVEIDE